MKNKRNLIRIIKVLEEGLPVMNFIKSRIAQEKNSDYFKKTGATFFYYCKINFRKNTMYKIFVEKSEKN